MSPKTLEDRESSDVFGVEAIDSLNGQDPDFRIRFPLTCPNHEGVASLPPTDFSQNCLGAGGACTVAMGQENVIAILLKQQKEVLRELQDQKKGISLSQANKDEIARIVLSSIEKRPLHEFGVAVRPPFPWETRRASAGSSKRVTPVRHRRKHFCSSHSSGTNRMIRDGSNQQHSDRHGFLMQKIELNQKPAKFYFPCSSDSYLMGENTTSTTIIRQRTERRPETVPVSLDGSWLLPSVPFLETHGLDGGESSKTDCWIEPSMSTPASLPSKTERASAGRLSSSEGKFKPPPATATSGAVRTKNHVRDRRSRVETTTGSAAWSTSYVHAFSNRSLSIHAEKDPTTSGRERVECSPETALRSTTSETKTTGKRGGGVPMSRGTLAMLERSRALVDKAKACVNPGRSSAPHLSKDGKIEDFCQAKESASANRDLPRHQIKPDENHGELGDLSGEASSILFPFFSSDTTPPGIGVVREENVACSLASPSVLGRRDSATVDQVPERSDVGHSNDGRGGISHHVGSRTKHLPGDDLGAAPTVAVEGHTLGPLSLTRDEEDAATREPELLDQEKECAGESNVSRCGDKSMAAAETAARGTFGRGGDATAFSATSRLSSSTKLEGALTIAGAGVHQQQRRTEIRLGCGAIDKSSVLMRAVVPSRCCNGSTSARGERGWSRSRVGGSSDDSAESPVKIDSEWENTLAKNILSLYQAKLKAELDEKKGALEEGPERKPCGYLTIAEEEELLWERQLQRRPTNRGDGDKTTHSTNKGVEPWGGRTVSKKRRGMSPCGGMCLPPPSCFPRRPATTTVLQKARVRAITTAPTLSSVFHRGRGIDTVAELTAGAVVDATPPRVGGVSKARSPPLTQRGVKAEANLYHDTYCRPRSMFAETGGGGDRCSPSTPSVYVAARNGLRRRRHGTAARVAESAGSTATTRLGRRGFKGNRTIMVPTRGGNEVVVVVPKRPTPVWFAGSGAIQAEWSALPGGARIVRDLEGLEEQGSYHKYVALVEGLMVAHLRADDQRGPTSLVKRLWRQLVVTCTAFGVRCTETRRFERALELLKRAGVLLSRCGQQILKEHHTRRIPAHDDLSLVTRQVLDKRETMELRAFISDAYGLYYLKRGKPTAALDYVQKAMRTHARLEDWGHLAKCHLHAAVVLSKLSRHDEALQYLGQVLSMVQEGKLDVGGNSPQKLCLVAICYHNVAVEHLIQHHVGEACMSSQNARRLARLCLSYSNRWLHSFEGTHKLALAELARTIPTPGEDKGSERGKQGDSAVTMAQRGMLDRLVEELFS